MVKPLQAVKHLRLIVPDSADTQEKLRRAIALLQLMVNGTDNLELFEIEDEVREQLEAWGVKMPDRDHDGDLMDDF